MGVGVLFSLEHIPEVAEKIIREEIAVLKKGITPDL
jgi:hypothetical protein